MRTFLAFAGTATVAHMFPAPAVDQWPVWSSPINIIRSDFQFSQSPSFNTHLMKFGDRSIGLFDGETHILHFPTASIGWVRVSQQMRSERKTPSWAIVLAVIGAFFFLLGLFFLLAKETVQHYDALVEIAAPDGRLFVGVVFDQQAGMVQAMLN